MKVIRLIQLWRATNAPSPEERHAREWQHKTAKRIETMHGNDFAKLDAQNEMHRLAQISPEEIANLGDY